MNLHMTSDDIHKAIRSHILGSGDYAYLKEFRAGTGYSSSSDRYLDAWAMQCWPSKPMLAIGIEIKISRSDFCRELRNPMKRDSALRICNEFYFAAPHGVITVDDLPPEAGLIEVTEDGNAQITEKAPYREVTGWTVPFIASLARRAMGAKE